MQRLKTWLGPQYKTWMFTLAATLLFLLSDLHRLITMPLYTALPVRTYAVRIARADEAVSLPEGATVELTSITAAPDADTVSGIDAPTPSISPYLVSAEIDHLSSWNSANCWSVVPEDTTTQIQTQVAFQPPYDPEAPHQFYAHVLPGANSVADSIRLGTVLDSERRTVSDMPVLRWMGGGIGAELSCHFETDNTLTVTLPPALTQQMRERSIAVEFYAIDWPGDARRVSASPLRGDTVQLVGVSPTHVRNIRVVVLPYHWIEFRGLVPLTGSDHWWR